MCRLTATLSLFSLNGFFIIEISRFCDGSESFISETSAIDQKSQTEQKLQELTSKMQSLKIKKNQITAEVEKLKIGLIPAYEKEKLIETKKKLIEEIIQLQNDRII